jgi:hypothetical protein
MAQTPAPKTGAAPAHLPEPPHEHWPDDAKEFYNQANAFMDVSVRVINEQQRVIQTQRQWLDLVEEASEP